MAFFYKILDLIPAQTAVILSQNCLFLQHFCFNFSFFYLAIQMYIHIYFLNLYLCMYIWW
jgi:hypothetical protein